MKKFDFRKILQFYGLHPESTAINEFLHGHINDSFIIDVKDSCTFFLQRINHHVFRDPEALIGNLTKVNNAMNTHFGRKNNPYPQILLNRNKKYFYLDELGNYWRMMEFVPESRSYNICKNVEVAREGAAAFGKFQLVMNTEDPAEYTSTIPDFHHLGRRISMLEEAIKEDEFNRCAEASAEIIFALARKHYAPELDALIRSGDVPVRVTHNDTKLNNVLFEKQRIKHICVVDLDTVMPGTVLYDYGDMVRTFTSPVEEDEPDPSKVIFRTDIFEALTDGYLQELKESLKQAEKENLLFGGKIMLLMIGIRFLTDFLEGDHYFKTSRQGHNLDRAKNQFALLKQLEEREEDLHAIVKKYC